MTLVEVMMVTAILAILLGVSISGLSNMSTPRRQTAVTMLKGSLDQTRAHAIASRRYTALMIVDGVQVDTIEPLNLVKYAIFEIGEPGTNGQYVTIVPPRLISEWKSLPGGVCFVKGMNGKPTVLDLPLTVDQFKVRGLSGSGYPNAVLNFTTGSPATLLAGIVFGPNGAVAAPRLTPNVQNLDLMLVEGVVEMSGSTSSVRPAHDPPRIEGVRLVRLTGVSRYLEDRPFNSSPSQP